MEIITLKEVELIIMKKSEELKKKAQQEENDIIAHSIYTDILREERKERFDKKYLNKLKEIVDVEERDNGSYTFESSTYGIVDFFPKANKLLIRTPGRWIKPAVKWIIKNIINK